MLYNVNFISYKFLYGKRLLFELYKHLIYRFNLTEQFAPWNFAKLLKFKKTDIWVSGIIRATKLGQMSQV